MSAAVVLAVLVAATTFLCATFMRLVGPIRDLVAAKTNYEQAIAIYTELEGRTRALSPMPETSPTPVYDLVAAEFGLTTAALAGTQGEVSGE